MGVGIYVFNHFSAIHPREKNGRRISKGVMVVGIGKSPFCCHSSSYISLYDTFFVCIAGVIDVNTFLF